MPAPKKQTAAAKKKAVAAKTAPPKKRALEADTSTESGPAPKKPKTSVEKVVEEPEESVEESIEEVPEKTIQPSASRQFFAIGSGKAKPGTRSAKPAKGTLVEPELELEKRPPDLTRSPRQIQQQTLTVPAASEEDKVTASRESRDWSYWSFAKKAEDHAKSYKVTCLLGCLKCAEPATYSAQNTSNIVLVLKTLATLCNI